MRNDNKAKTTVKTPTIPTVVDDDNRDWDITDWKRIPASAKKDATMYLPKSLLKRLGQYTIDRLDGSQSERSRIVSQALDEWLKREGY